MSSLESKIPPPIVALVVAAAMWGVAAVGPALPLPKLAANLATGALAIAGATVDALALLAFRAARTTVDPLRPERASALVTRGIYRVTRNPMYVGLCCFLLAWAFHLSALLPFAGPAAFAAYVTRFQIVPEERTLERIFGAAYTHYAARVRRWL